MKNRLNKIRFNGQAGQALLLVLIFFLMGSLTIAPVLGYMGTALKTEAKYEAKTGELFTADAGIETGLWRIKYDFMGPDYDPYDYETAWPYETDPVNNRTADVLVQNVWLPSNVTLDSLGLTAAQAKAMIESEKLVISGTSGAVPGQPFYIKMDFTPASGDNLTIKSIGVWLPQGFDYHVGDSELEQLDAFDPCRPDAVSIDTVPGGTAIVWSYNAPYPLFASFPKYALEDNTMTVTFSFTYDPPAGDPDKMPLAVTWVTTEMEPSCPNGNNVPMSWDTDMRYYKITSVSGGTDIQTYQSKSQLRSLGNGIAGDCVAIGNSLMVDPENNIYTRWLPSSDYTLSTNPADGDVLYAYLYWSGFRTLSNVIWSDTCTDFDNWDRNSADGSQTRVPEGDGDISGTWNTAPCWDDVDETTPNDVDFMTGTTDGGGYKLFTFSAFSVPEQPVASLVVTIRAKDAGGTGNNDIRPAIKVNGTVYYDSTTHNPGTGFTTYSCTWDENPNTTDPWTAADINGTGPNPLQQIGVRSSDLNPDMDVSIVYAQVNYSSYWTIYNDDDFQGRGGSNSAVDPRLLTLTDGINLSSYAPGTIAILWTQSESGTLEAADTLYYALSNNNGATWSSDIEAFHDDNPSSPFYALVPDDYLTAGFKLRYYFNFNSAEEYVRLDNINFYYMPPDTSITFKIDDQQVYLDAEGNPQSDEQPLTVSAGSVILNSGFGGYSYACKRDVTRLVKKYPEVIGEEHHTGNAKYTVGDVQADTGVHVSYAGWSLIIIYASPQTAGHYLYLYDVFSFNPQNTNLDFDYDGDPGGDISGFLFPEPIRNKEGQLMETVAAKLTVFVGEGDAWLYGSVPNTDSIKATGQQSVDNWKYLYNSASPDYNLWNSGSYPCTTLPGIDIDTFNILWTDNILTPKDTRLTLDLYSGQDAWNLVYFILSVRSETVTSGTGHYLIDSN